MHDGLIIIGRVQISYKIILILIEIMLLSCTNVDDKRKKALHFPRPLPFLQCNVQICMSYEQPNYEKGYLCCIFKCK